MVPLIEKALRTSALKLNPRSEGQELVVPVPRCLLGTGEAMCLLMCLPMFLLPRGLAMFLLPTSLVTCQLLEPACSQDVHVKQRQAAAHHMYLYSRHPGQLTMQLLHCSWAGCTSWRLRCSHSGQLMLSACWNAPMTES